ncbi:unnamed protein product [Rotaria sordida]|uniref:Uncharacterized protein n=1 Tax=Rotaria sordida TaxID=392033 RepID=A0A814TXI0_9BILA|nr:unnamed protein product [Rotaria sordida]CAF0931560.1 unnamed protein product [Rotaria sordida]CAF1166738.1 unnamed protein product [Rotaria sordida]CAF3594648.1 unnamed protein product [Rotaria sordida]
MSDYDNIENLTLPSTNEDHILNNCSLQPINIDTLQHKIESNDQRENQTMIRMTSSWKQIVVKTDDNHDHSQADDDDDHDDSQTNEINDNLVSFTPLNTIQVIFTIPDIIISNETILNQTIFITDVKSNQLLASLNYICFNGSSFIINYSTNKSLPHDVCLYVLISSIALKEIFICRTINNISNINKGHSDQSSRVFIISQCIVNCLMMIIIYLVHIGRKKNLINRVGQHFLHNKLVTHKNSVIIFHDRINPDIINNIHLNNLISSPIEEQVLAANDLISTRNDRRFTHHALIDVTELTKQMNLSNKNIESNAF